jgi:glycosyltransferase involved in cell wall biosynthesis
MSKIRVIHVINSLHVGGAERMLQKLLAEYDLRKFEMSVITLKNIGLVGEEIRANGVSVLPLNMNGFMGSIKGVFKLRKLLKKQQPDILQSWLYHADFFCFLASIGLKNIINVWNLRASKLEHKRYRYLLVILLGIISWFKPKLIISCGVRVKRNHIRLGYCASKIKIIPNGIATDKFKPNIDFFTEVREQLGLLSDDIVVGVVGRFSPSKDYKTLIKAAKIVTQKFSEVYFLCCGWSVEWQNKKLSKWIQENNLEDRFILLGQCNDVNKILNSFNVFVLSSNSEGFPNILGEAMACGVPCVATDVGDSKYIIDDSNQVARPKDPQALASAIIMTLQLNNNQRNKLKMKSRERIVNNFKLEKVVKQYQGIYNDFF